MKQPRQVEVHMIQLMTGKFDIENANKDLEFDFDLAYPIVQYEDRAALPGL